MIFVIRDKNEGSCACVVLPPPPFGGGSMAAVCSHGPDPRDNMGGLCLVLRPVGQRDRAEGSTWSVLRGIWDIGQGF